MAHPYNDKRNHKVEHARVADITAACGGHMATGGGVHGDVVEDKSLIRKMVKSTALKLVGGAVKARADRPGRARGGRLGMKKKGNKGHTVNVIVAPHAPAPPPMIPGLGAAPPAPMMKPPMPPVGPSGPGMGGPPVAGGAPLPPGVPPPGMRYAGGRTRQKGGRVFSGSTKPSFTTKTKSADAKVGNKADSQTAGIGVGRTPIRRDFASNKQDTPNIGRKPSILKATGGPITSNYGFRKGMAPHAKGGAMGGLAKLDKANHPSKYVCD